MFSSTTNFMDERNLTILNQNTKELIVLVITSNNMEYYSKINNFKANE
ncbi:hypothetical protein [Brumimicrobium mesophilum]|nr:hypothetical protein [Brumimicrobium mesophilum]